MFKKLFNKTKSCRNQCMGFISVHRNQQWCLTPIIRKSDFRKSIFIFNTINTIWCLKVNSLLWLAKPKTRVNFLLVLTKNYCFRDTGTSQITTAKNF